MTVRLSTQRVFLDTQVFVSSQFNYHSQPFRALAEHIKSGRVQLFLTDLTIREIRSNLQRMSAEALNLFSAARKRALLPVRNSGSAAALFVTPDSAAIVTEALADIDRFLASCNPTVLQVKDAYLTPVLDDYFARKPPFGEGKDKSQFPDALVIATLTDFSKHDREICAVSADEAFRAACSPLYHLTPYESLPRFLDAVASEDDRASFIYDLVIEADDLVKPMIKEQFEKLTFDLPTEWGEVQEVEVAEISLEDREPDILMLLSDSAVVQEYASVRFWATGEQVIDDETGETDSFRVETTVERSVAVFVQTDYKSPETARFDVEVDNRDVRIRLEEL